MNENRVFELTIIGVVLIFLSAGFAFYETHEKSVCVQTGMTHNLNITDIKELCR
jgi:hypothetical protein